MSEKQTGTVGSLGQGLEMWLGDVFQHSLKRTTRRIFEHPGWCKIIPPVDMCTPVGNELSSASAPMHTIHYKEPHHQSTCISFLLQLSSCFTKSLLVQRKKLSEGLERTYWTTDWELKVQLLQVFGFLLKSYYL